MEMCNMARITELKNEGPKSKSSPKKVKFYTEEKNNYSGKEINESKYHLKEDEPEQIESLLAFSQRISNLDNNDPLLHLKFENTHSSNIKASTIKVEPVQRKSSKPKQLVKSVSNKYGQNGTYWKKKKDSVSNEEYSNYSKVKGSSKIKRYFPKIISKIENNHKSQAD
ncbi:hypothetical protein O181_085989 [Austropuccinia psidii MF-1]|uniref:Uncharacterized protein n=1 Tax=Austropuccinia psidii MF-1 TaxID=1389203 RepID=A0A9Q3FWB4_9BASI|nr:hypothetical protein [Austropuccinia psidii MF-1]